MTMEGLIARYPALESCKNEIGRAAEAMLSAYRSGGKILVCGNGGSCADADHIVGELMKGFLQKRCMTDAQKERFRAALEDKAEPLVEQLQRGIPAISLPAQSAVLSAFANDVDAELVYAQMVFGYAKEGDLFLGLSTSGNAGNVVAAARVAKAMGLRTLALTGERESALSEICDVTVRVPECETFRVQELHLPVYHYLCAWVEESLFG
ncbi:MAG: SIS domain-containing protein [Clostridia bacterium]|nr:SIS domain-containing protein [Clostridia bacterium]